MESRTVLLISSDHVGWGDLRAMLAAMPEVRVVGKATDTIETRRFADAHQPDAIIAETHLDGRSLVPLLGELHRDCCPASKIILLGARYEPGQVRAPGDIGIVGYLLWSDLSHGVLHHALALLLTGDVVLASREVVERFVVALRGAGPLTTAPLLTVHERAVLGRLAAGLTYEEIARAEPLSVRAVERTVAALKEKFDAPNQFVLAKKAVQMGLIR